MSKSLNPNTQKLFDQLVLDLTSKLAPEERVFKKEYAPSLIYNLFRGEYEFSTTMFNELYEYLSNPKNHE